MPVLPLRYAVPLLALAAALPAAAQWVPQRYALTAEERVELENGRSHLARRLAELEAATPPAVANRIPDAEIFLDAVSRELREELFFNRRDVEYARACLREGESRVDALKSGQAPWRRQAGIVNLGYRSRVDGSVQPYQLYVPATGARAGKQRLHIFLHGRSGQGSEISFLNGKSWTRGLFGTDAPDEMVLTPYGRGNNGWRFAGERDLFEALEDVEREHPEVDSDNIALRGFSMGGHGCWHTGLQHPGMWAVMSPGAGFVDTIQYNEMTQPLPPWQRALLHMYDPVDYSANAKNLPVLAYSGEIDPAISQHRLILGTIRGEGAPVREYIGPKTAHSYEAETLRRLVGDMRPLRRQPDAPRVDFVTYTTRWADDKWVRVEGLERQWERAEVHGALESPGHIRITTRNVSALRLLPPASFIQSGRLSVTMDGTELVISPVQPAAHTSAATPTELPPVPEGGVWLRKSASGWTVGEPRGLRKKPGLQGPIDDALFGPVLVVRPTGGAWSAGMDRWLYAERMRFRDGWDEFFRAALPEKADDEVTRADIGRCNLYLFGDPGSNAVLRRLLPRLPIRWTRDEITVAGHRFSTRDHLPMLVYPNPENPERYVVINSSFTFSRDDWHGSNARQYPHLPDFAVIRYDADRFSDQRPDDTVLAGFFNEQWQFGAEPWTSERK